MAKKSKPANPWPEVLKALRERTGWTQEQAAEAVGLKSRISWFRWETGAQTPQGPALVAMKCILKEHAPELLKKVS